MTPIDTQAARARCSCLVGLNDPADPYPSDMVGSMARDTLALCDRIETLEKALAEACDLADSALDQLAEMNAGNCDGMSSNIYHADKEARRLRSLLAKGDGE